MIEFRQALVMKEFPLSSLWSSLKTILIPTTLLLSFLLASCSTPRPEGKTEAEILYKEAIQLSEEGRYILATERINTLRSQFPYSFYATHAELLQADILFSQENFVESAAAYILFRDFHPKHEKIPYVLFRIAESFHKQLPDTFDRDLSAAYEAIRYYGELLSLYPNTDYAKNAESKIKEAQDLLLKKEQYIADFYYKTEVYDSARFRYLKILESFNEPKLIEHSLNRVLLASIELEDFDGCLKYYNQFIEKINQEKQNRLTDTALKCRRD